MPEATERAAELIPAPGADGGAARTARPALFLSVVVPVRNEARFIEWTLQCLLEQDYDPARFEILVIDGQSNDGTPEIVARMSLRHANLRLLENPRRLSSAARNIGVRNARGEVILLVDGHCEIRDRRHLRRVASAFQRSGADALGRPQPQDVTAATPLQRAVAAARSSWLGHHPDSFIYSSQERFAPAESVAIAYRRGVFDRVGLFDESFDACEDVELNHRIDRAGLRCCFVPEIAVHYFPRGTLTGLFRQMVRYGRGRVRLWRKHRDTFSVTSFLPAALVAGFFAGLAALWVSHVLAMVYAAVLAIYVAAVVVVSLAQSIAHRDAAILPWLPPVFATIHFACGMGAIAEYLALRRPAANVTDTGSGAPCGENAP